MISPINIDEPAAAAAQQTVVNLVNPASTALLDEDLYFIQASAGFEKLLGVQPEQLQGALLTDVLYEFVGVEEDIKAILKGKSERFLFDNISRQLPGGENRYLSFQIARSMDNQASRNLLLLVEDRSDINRMQQSLIQDRNELRLARRQLTELNEELAQLNRLKSLFLSMAAHDLRTPLSSIQGYAELLREELAYEKRHQDLFDVILSQAYRLQQLINDLLDLDQIERGDMHIIFRDCFLDEIIDEVVTAMRPLAYRAKVEIEVECQLRPFPLYADPRRMAQILYNLLGNSIKYTPAGGGVRIIARENQNQAIIFVSDDGPGIDNSVLKNLFEAYYPVQQGEDRSEKSGTGLGLYIVKLLVEAHQGQVHVDSSPDHGTTFTIYLPK